MSLDKAIKHHKEHRQPYYGSKSVDKTCRNHGSCGWCKNNRLYKSNKKIESMSDKLDEYDEILELEEDINEEKFN